MGLVHLVEYSLTSVVYQIHSQQKALVFLQKEMDGLTKRICEDFRCRVIFFFLICMTFVDSEHSEVHTVGHE